MIHAPLLAALAALAPSAVQAQDSAGEIPWRTDLDAAVAEAAREHEPLLIVFR